MAPTASAQRILKVRIDCVARIELDQSKYIQNSIKVNAERVAELERTESLQ